jgi:hypothetical protein
MAELASAFLVISQASSSTTGSMVREHMPMMAITTKIAARLLGLTVKRASPVHECDTKYGTGGWRKSRQEKDVQPEARIHLPTQMSTSQPIPTSGAQILANSER